MNALNSQPSTLNIISRQALTIHARTKRAGRKKGKQIREGSVVVRIFDVRGAGRAARKEVRYQFAGRRERKLFPSAQLAEEFAREQALRIANGRGSSELSADERILIEFCRAHGIRVKDLQLVLAIKARGMQMEERLGVKLAPYQTFDQFCAEHEKRAAYSGRDTADVVKHFLAEIEAIARRQNGSLYHWRDLTGRLQPFASNFPGNFADVDPKQVGKWIGSLTHHDEALAPKTLNHYRAAIVQCARWAREQRIIDVDRLREFTALTKYDPGVEPTDPFPLRDVRTIFYYAAEEEPELVPALVHGFFIGHRLEEIRSRHKPAATWDQVNFETDIVSVSKKQSKVKCARIAPLWPNARAWLLAFRSEGLISSHWVAIAPKLRKICESCGVKYIANGMRHSFLSYRVAVDNDIAAAADAAGTSVSKVNETYRKPLTKKEGKAYFEILPPSRMPLFEPRPSSPTRHRDELAL